MKRDEFERQFRQLLNLLKKMLKNHPGEPHLSRLIEQVDSGQINLNLCIFNMMPLTPEEMDELEDAFMGARQEEAEEVDEKRVSEEEFGWNSNDVEFLRRYGMSL